VHHCIGAEIARVELTVVLTKLFQRIPDLKLAKPWNELQYKDGAVMYGVYEMPVTW
jgi:cytochrome P450